MAPKITTKPFASRAQQRFAFGTDQPWAKRWAAETDFDALPARVGKRKGKKYGKRTKAALVCTCKAEQLAPGITRIRGNLCNVHGRYGPCDQTGAANASVRRGIELSRSAAQRAGKRSAARRSASGAKRASGGKKRAAGGGKAPAKPKQPAKTPEQREQEREAKRAEQRQAVIDAMAQGDAGLQPAAAKALLSFADGKEDPTYTEGLIKAGLMERGRDGAPRLTAAGRAAVAAMDRGDTRDALDAIGRGADRVAAGTEREQAAAERKRAAEERRNKRRGGGKRAQSRQPTPEQQQREQERQRRQQEADTRRAQRDAEHAQDRAERKRRQAEADRRRVEADRRRQQREQQADQRRQQQEQERDATKQRRLDDIVDAMTSGTRLRDTQIEQLVDAGLARRDGAMVRLTAAGQARARRKRQKSFAIFKDARGQYRWLAHTTTAYRDRDGEILSVKGLDANAQRMAQTGQYGPLRYWHIGQPDPTNADAPWGIGLDIGDCDFSMLIGRTLVESGTFRSQRVAEKMAADADNYEMSPGFFHDDGQPDASKVFDDFWIFERSPVPRDYARASNLFTSFRIKEHRMDPKEFERRLKVAKDKLGLSDEQTTQERASLIATDKAAAQRQIAYKSDSAPKVYELADGTLGAVIDGHFVTLKAAGDMPADATDGELPADAGDGADAGGDTAEFVGDMSPDEFRQLLREEFQAAIGEFGGSITTKMGEIDGMLKSMGYSRLKEAQVDDQRTQEIAKLKEQIAQQQTKLQELTGDQPANQEPPSSADADVQAALKSNGPAQAEGGQTNGWNGIFERVASGGAAAAFQQWQAQRPPQS